MVKRKQLLTKGKQWLQTKVDKITAELAVKKVSKDVIKINNNQKGNNDR